MFGIQEAYPEQESFILKRCPEYGGFGVGRDDECLNGVNLIMHDARTDAPVTTGKPSFNGFGLMESKIIDYIYYRGFTSAEEFKVVDDTFDGKAYISDHYPIEAVLKI